MRIPPARQPAIVIFMMAWLFGWGAGMRFGLGEIAAIWFGVPGIFMLIWLVPWTLGGAGVLWVIGWQLFGVEQLFVTAGALVREWNLFGLGRRRVVDGRDIRSVTVDQRATNDVFALGSISVKTGSHTLHIGSGLDPHEAELVAALISRAVIAQEPDPSTLQDEAS